MIWRRMGPARFLQATGSEGLALLVIDAGGVVPEEGRLHLRWYAWGAGHA